MSDANTRANSDMVRVRIQASRGQENPVALESLRILARLLVADARKRVDSCAGTRLSVAS